MKAHSRLGQNRGFTLFELLVATAVSGIVMAAVYSVYYSQQKTALVQKHLADMQQNLRAAMHLIETEIRMAGYDSSGRASAGIQAASATSIRFTSNIHDGTDNDGDGSTDETDEAGNCDRDVTDTNEDITYQTLDPDGDGVFSLYRIDAVAGTQLVAENIDVLNFVYLDEDGADLGPTPTLSEIRSVQITMVARTGRSDRGYADHSSYANQQGTVILSARNDEFRRRRLTAEVKCRNLGI
jgi:type IV pilus assembly protein PilW